MYKYIINSDEGFLADYLAQSVMMKAISKFSRDDFFTTEEDIFIKLPGLRSMLEVDQNFKELILTRFGAPSVRRVREFYVDKRGDFFRYQDRTRYRQRKRLTHLRTGASKVGALSSRGAAMVGKEAGTAIERAHSFSSQQIEILRDRLVDVSPQSTTVVTCGSYARREASRSSDLDFFVIKTNGSITERTEGDWRDPERETWVREEKDWLNDVHDAIAEVVIIEPSEDGAFAQTETVDAIIHNIGGAHDTNAKFSRRILLLLEGEWLTNGSLFVDIRKKLLERYVSDSMSDHQLALFLLNDIIRYYRTVCIDYEFKTAEADKPWGIRNIKLIFSRKLMYASGVFSVACTVDRTYYKKREILEELFSLPVLQRMVKICGEQSMNGVTQCYEYFLSKFEDTEVRERLKAITPEKRKDDPLFRELKNEGHNFTRELLKLFERTFDTTHPIRRAILF